MYQSVHTSLHFISISVYLVVLSSHLFILSVVLFVQILDLLFENSHSLFTAHEEFPQQTQSLITGCWGVQTFIQQTQLHVLKHTDEGEYSPQILSSLMCISCFYACTWVEVVKTSFDSCCFNRVRLRAHAFLLKNDFAFLFSKNLSPLWFSSSNGMKRSKQ